MSGKTPRDRKWLWILLSMAVAAAASARATEIVCHRGMNKMAPENTLAAAEKCVEFGMDYVEFDVRRSSDGVMYLMHDVKVDRTTNGSGFLRELTSAQVDQLDAGSWFGPEYAGEHVPRLDNYLRTLKGRIKFYFDVKDADLAELIGLVRDVGIEQDSFYWFENNDWAREFRRLAPDLNMKINVSTVEDVRKAADEYQANVIEVRLNKATPELIQACRDRHIEVMVYEPLLKPDAFAEIVRLGADKVNLNNGDVFRQVQEELLATPAAAAPESATLPEAAGTGQ